MTVVGHLSADPPVPGAVVDHVELGDVGLAIRLGTTEDAQAVAAIYRPWVRDTRVSLEVEPPSADEMATRIQATLPRWPWLVAETSGGRVVGYAYGGAHRARSGYRWTVEVSAYVAAAAHRQGVGRHLCLALLRLLEAQGYRQAVAGIGLPNEASIRFHEALGFRHVGTIRAVGRKFADWQDVGWWQRALGEGDDTDPAEPLPLDELAPTLIARLLA